MRGSNKCTRQVTINREERAKLKKLVLVWTHKLQPLDISSRKATHAQCGHVHQGMPRQVRRCPRAIDSSPEPLSNQHRQMPAVVEVCMRQKDSINTIRLEWKGRAIRGVSSPAILLGSAVHQVIPVAMIQQRARTSHAPKSANKANLHDTLLSARDLRRIRPLTEVAQPEADLLRLVFPCTRRREPPSSRWESQVAKA